MERRYHALPSPPDEITPGVIIGRMFAGMGFRFYWATEDLTEEIYAFQPVERARTIGETVDHIWDTLNWIYRSIDASGKDKPTGATSLRNSSLDLIAVLEDSFSRMKTADLQALRIRNEPFWLILNGPLSDILTHIGQIATLRRMAGSPAPASNPFRGLPPTGR